MVRTSENRFSFVAAHMLNCANAVKDFESFPLKFYETKPFMCMLKTYQNFYNYDDNLL